MNGERNGEFGSKRHGRPRNLRGFPRMFALKWVIWFCMSGNTSGVLVTLYQNRMIGVWGVRDWTKVRDKWLGMDNLNRNVRDVCEISEEYPSLSRFEVFWFCMLENIWGFSRDFVSKWTIRHARSGEVELWCGRMLWDGQFCTICQDRHGKTLRTPGDMCQLMQLRPVNQGFWESSRDFVFKWMIWNEMSVDVIKVLECSRGLPWKTTDFLRYVR